MRRVVVAVALAFVAPAALAGCAPKEDYTPLIAVEPYAVHRICWFCVERRTRDEVTCPVEVEQVCAVLRSDVKGPPVITFTGSADD